MSLGIACTYSYIFKYIIVGDMGVGKSCLMHQFTEKKFIPDCPHTIGVEFAPKVIEVDGQKVKLQIWDTAGQERFRAVTRSYYRGAACVILVFDITRKSTFKLMTNWLTDARRLTYNDPVIFMVGNKADLDDQRDVSYAEAKTLADENDLEFFECSAKLGNNVEEVFLKSARRIYARVLEGGSSLNSAEAGLHNRSITGPDGPRNTVDLSAGNTSASVSAETGRQGCSC